MMRLDDREWKPVPMSKLFPNGFVRGKIYSATDETKDAKGIPYVGATDRNNGVIDFIQPDSNRKQPGNCIVFVRDGQGSVGSSIYRSTPFIATVNVSAGYAPWINQYTGLFVSVASNMVRAKYGFGYKRKEERLKAERVMLPVNDAGEPDYQFMEDYIRELTVEKKKQYRHYLEKQITELGAVPDEQTVDWAALIDSREWKPFYISQIFDEPQRGKRIVNENHIEGGTPLVSSQGTNNGVTNFVGNEDGVRRFKNCLSIANGGSSAGKCYYQPFEFVAADHVTQCFHMNASPAQYLFLSAIVSKALMGKYGFSHEIKDKALVRERVLLPVTDAGKPDYDFMEQFGRKMMQFKYLQYLLFIAGKET